MSAITLIVLGCFAHFIIRWLVLGGMYLGTVLNVLFVRKRVSMKRGKTIDPRLAHSMKRHLNYDSNSVVFSFLSSNDLARARRVCRDWNHVIEIKKLFRSHTAKHLINLGKELEQLHDPTRYQITNALRSMRLAGVSHNYVVPSLIAVSQACDRMFTAEKNVQCITQVWLWALIPCAYCILSDTLGWFSIIGLLVQAMAVVEVYGDVTHRITDRTKLLIGYVIAFMVVEALTYTFNLHSLCIKLAIICVPTNLALYNIIMKDKWQALLIWCVCLLFVYPYTPWLPIVYTYGICLFWLQFFDAVFKHKPWEFWFTIVRRERRIELLHITYTVFLVAFEAYHRVFYWAETWLLVQFVATVYPVFTLLDQSVRIIRSLVYTRGVITKIHWRATALYATVVIITQYLFPWVRHTCMQVIMDGIRLLPKGGPLCALAICVNCIFLYDSHGKTIALSRGNRFKIFINVLVILKGLCEWLSGTEKTRLWLTVVLMILDML